MTTPTDRNRLTAEASPYLRQHADNPVNWQPWDDRAFEIADDHDVPVFVSIGYSACHWCHVMEEESFSDPDVAELLNESFVPVKVDREERPDVDSVFMTICQLVTGGGGWPLSAWCTPEGDPFYVGTYFPPEPTRGRPGFTQLCERIADSWSDPDQRAEMESRAEQWRAAARDRVESVPDQPGESPGEAILEEAAAAAVRGYDEEHGGFGSSGPKFPQPGRIELLSRAYAVSGRDAFAEAMTGTLDAMAAGGVYDQIGGGFHRYATDRSWTVPHFEKMLYDNAELPRVYLRAHQQTGDPRYARIARETFAFVERELTSEDGGFYGTLDARSVPPESRPSTSGDPEEGAFYTWTPEEVDAVLEEPAASLARDRYGISPGGNFEGGTTVPTLAASIDDLAAEHDLDRSSVGERLMDARVSLHEAREERPRPARDEKVIAGWNGRMISAFAAGARVLDPSLADRAESTLAFHREHLWDAEEGRLDRRIIDGDRQGPGYLGDYAYLARGAFDTYQVTGEIDHLAFAIDLADRVVDAFYDEDAGTMYTTPAQPEDGTAGSRLSVRPRDLTDRSLPSSVGIAAGLLADLDGFVGGDSGRPYRRIAERVVETHADRIEASPLEHVSLALLADRLERGGTELVIVGPELPTGWWETLSETYLPNATVAPRPSDDDRLDEWTERLGLTEVPPVWAGRDARSGETTVYACHGFACSPPETDLEDALEWLRARE
jgi:uncharacterized protein YyaL (SSP411 family)